MPSPSDVIDRAIGEVDSLRKLLKKGKNRQVRSKEERTTAKATALAWFHTHRAELSGFEAVESFKTAEGLYQRLLNSSDLNASRQSYELLLKNLRRALTGLRVDCVISPISTHSTADEPPVFAPLVTDIEMQEVLTSRWRECVKCLGADAPMAAIVMMGGLIEALLVARIVRETNQKPIFMAKLAPLDDKGKSRPLNEWTLKNYIDVVHELGWISETAKDISEVVRDYRNYIHPSKQLRHGKQLTVDDATMFWEVSKAVSREVIRSAPPRARARRG